jgi:hypothetical protein
VPAPTTGCLEEWEKGLLVVDERRPGRERLAVKLRRGPALEPSGFGDPLATGGTAYTGCIYDDEGTLVGRLEVDRAGETCGAKPCWKRTSSGYTYKDATASADGVSQLKVKGGAASRSQVMLKGGNKKGRLDLPLGIATGLTGSSSATVQVHTSDAPACFSRTFKDVRRSEASFLEAE